MINCVNTGLISDISKSESVAGIIGRNEAKAKVFNSYNLGDIISPGLQVGEIIGSFGGNVTIGTIKNAYNVGTIVDKKVTWTYGAGSMCGYFYNNNTQLTIENGYYLKNTCSRAVENKEDSLYGVTQIESIEENSVKELFNSYIE